jgi:predicted NBD/HSP70 family sugar kinase
MTQMAIGEAIICTQRGEASVLRETLAKDGTISPERLFEAARGGDGAARRVTDRVARELGRIMAIMTDILNPEVFVLGTIGTAYPDLLIPGAKRALGEIALEPSAAIVDIRPSSLTERGDQQALAVAHYTFAGSRGE